uniref:Uncharacterized protein n=1 Tax=Anopheles arabiensis TaxID=7173 RepID=A0A182IFZ6_ANOAR
MTHCCSFICNEDEDRKAHTDTHTHTIRAHNSIGFPSRTANMAHVHCFVMFCLFRLELPVYLRCYILNHN